MHTTEINDASHLDYDFFEDDGPRITDTGASTPPCIIDDNEKTTTTTTQVVQVNESLRLTLARDPLVGTGGLLWPAGKVLATYLLAHPHLLVSKSVVELGSGTGIVGLACAASITTMNRIVLTDLSCVLPVLSQNAKLNKLQESVSVQALPWGEPVPPSFQDCDVVLLADCVYLESLFQPLIHTLTQLMVKQHAVAYLCYKKRRKADARFFKLLKKVFLVEELDITESINREGIRLYCVVKK